VRGSVDGAQHDGIRHRRRERAGRAGGRWRCERHQRFLDVKVSAPREYAVWEREIRDRVRAVAQRGRVEVTWPGGRSPRAAATRSTCAPSLARAYVHAARRLARTLDLHDDVSLAAVLRLPDLFEVSEEAPDPRAELGAAAPRARPRAPRVRHGAAARGRESQAATCNGGRSPSAAPPPTSAAVFRCDDRAPPPGRGASRPPGGWRRARPEPGGAGGRRAGRPRATSRRSWCASRAISWPSRPRCACAEPWASGSSSSCRRSTAS